MVQIKHFTAPQNMPNFQVSRRAKWSWPDKILGAPPAQPENYCESKQTHFSYSLDKAFHSPEFQAKLFFTRNWVGGFNWDSLLITLDLALFMKFKAVSVSQTFLQRIWEKKFKITNWQKLGSNLNSVNSSRNLTNWGLFSFVFLVSFFLFFFWLPKHRFI